MTLLSITGLSYEVRGQKILDDISYDINEGDFISIGGPSGSGKSSLLKIIATIISKTEGEILYKEIPLEQYEPTQYRKEVSYCFQSPVLFGKTVKDNLSFPYEIRHMEFDKEKAVTLLSALGLSESDLEKDVKFLSGGEKQRVALIRNMLFEPKVLLLDEVTSALDDANRTIIWNWLRALKKKGSMTILMVTHNDAEASLAEKNIQIVDGKISTKEEF
jgi:putative ABC transport system ATP-binding protein